MSLTHEAGSLGPRFVRSFGAPVTPVVWPVAPRSLGSGASAPWSACSDASAVESSGQFCREPFGV